MISRSVQGKLSYGEEFDDASREVGIPMAEGHWNTD